MNVGEKIKSIRISKNLTQKQLGELCGMADSAIRRYECGGANPKVETLGKIATALGVSINELRSDSDLILGNLFFGAQSALNLEVNRLVEDDSNKIKLLENYDKLNTNGKEEALKRMSELTELEKYTKKTKKKVVVKYRSQDKINKE